MFCGNCGKENKDSVNFCTACGNNLQEIKQNSITTERPSKKKRGKVVGMLVVVWGMIFFAILICVILKTKDYDSGSSKKNENKLEREKDTKKTTEKEYDKDAEEERIRDTTCKDGVINRQGNSFNNLSYQSALIGANPPEFSGRVTGQGESVYYYLAGKICRLDGQGNRTEICSEKYASCLNVIGNTLYYLKKGEIYSVDIMGGEPQKRVSGVIGNFFIFEGTIYYVNCEKATGTTYNFFVNEYSLDKGQVERSIEAGNYMPTLVSVNPDKNGEIIYFYQQKNQSYPNYTANGQPFDVIRTDLDGNKEVYSYDDSNSLQDSNGYMLLGLDSWYFSLVHDQYPDFVMHRVDNETHSVIGCVEESISDWYDIKMPKNSYGDKLIFGIISENGYGLHCITFEEIHGITSKTELMNETLIIAEQEIIEETYVLGEYIYYTLGEYANATLYRVKVDGSDWEELK